MKASIAYKPQDKTQKVLKCDFDTFTFLSKVVFTLIFFYG